MQVAVGRILKPHGLRGELVVEVRTDEPEQRFAVGTSLRLESRLESRLDGRPREVTIRAVRRHGERLVVRFDGVGDRTAADGLRGAVLTVEVAELPPVEDPEEFYDHQLVGLRVELPDGTPVGVVADVTHGPGGDLLVVSRDGLPDALVPFVHQIVPDVDVAGGRVLIDPPEGLLDQ